MGFFDLSIRRKLPMWGGGLILATAGLIATPFLLDTHDEIKRDMLFDSEALGLTLAEALNEDLIGHDVRHAYQIIRAPFVAQQNNSYFKFETILVVDMTGHVFASSRPDSFPFGADLRAHGGQFARLWAQLAVHRHDTLFDSEGDKALVAIPIHDNGIDLGNLVIVHDRDFHFDRFLEPAKRAAVFTLLALALLLPVSWYWGMRMARPLVQLADRMKAADNRLPEPLPPNAYPYRDELGLLFRQFDRMTAALQEEERLRQAVIESEHLAALGTMAAGIAHEINNPLGGLITAVDTLKRHGSHDAVSDRVVPLLERGLDQIRETVSAMLVEVRTGGTRHLNRQDVEDVGTMVRQGTHGHGARVDIDNGVAGDLPLPANLVRQILLNLLLNACQASNGGAVSATVGISNGELIIEVANAGEAIPEAIRKHLFDPFIGAQGNGHGLGLWVTSQIVRQLRGDIAVASRDGKTRFTVRLPLGASE